MLNVFPTLTAIHVPAMRGQPESLTFQASITATNGAQLTAVRGTLADAKTALSEAMEGVSAHAFAPYLIREDDEALACAIQPNMVS